VGPAGHLPPAGVEPEELQPAQGDELADAIAAKLWPDWKLQDG
jgi:hypothetical protein